MLQKLNNTILEMSEEIPGIFISSPKIPKIHDC